MSAVEPPSMQAASAATQAALNNAVEGGGEGAVPLIADTLPVTPVQAETPAVVPETPAEPVLNLDGIDLSSLDPTIAKRIQDGFLRQQDYTRKTQEIAPIRKLAEEFGDADALRQSAEFVSRLQNDPDFLRQVAQELQEYATPANVATEQPLVPQEIPQGADSELIRSVNELNAWRAEENNRRIQEGLVADLQVKIQDAENAIRESNPSYTQAEIDKIYGLAPNHDYDLFKAQENFEELRSYFVNETLKPKLNYPNAANPVSTGSLANQPDDVNDFAAAAAATRERLRQAGE